MIVVPASTSTALADKIVKSGGYEKAEVESKAFPDGELYVRIKTDLAGKDALVVCSTTHSASIIELLLLLEAARELGAKSINCLLPYFGYARQHKKYNDGEPVSSRAITRALEHSCDTLMTVDIHDEQTLGYSSKPFTNIRIEKPISDYFSKKQIDYVFAPDDGGAVKAESVAKLLGVEGKHMEKKRIDSNTVEMELPEAHLQGKNVLLVDDMISSGGTIIKANKLLRDSGVKKVYVCAVHGLFANGADARIAAAVDELVVTDTVQSSLSKISVAGSVVSFLKHH
jgi:ribose-phosphate pyrophosphokinase